MIKWAQTNAHDLLDALLNGPTSDGAVYWVHQLRRHASVAETFTLGDIDLWLISEKPHWLEGSVADTIANPAAPLPLNLE